MPDRFKPHNYLNTLGQRWVEWTNDYLVQQPSKADCERGFEGLLYPGNDAPPADGRSRATEMHKYGLLRGRLTPAQVNTQAVGWQLLCNNQHVHTPLGYLEWLLVQELPAQTATINQAQSILAALLTIQWYVEETDGPRISYVTLFEWLKQQFPYPTSIPRLIWLQTLAAAMFCTTYTISSSDALLADLVDSAAQPRLRLVWSDGRIVHLTNVNLIDNLVEGSDFDELRPARSLNYWIGKAPDPRGNYSLAESSAPLFLAAFAAEELRLLRQESTATPEPFRSLLYKNPNQEAPDIIGLLPELAKLPALTQPTHQLMKTLREGAIEAIQQLYGADAVAEIQPQGQFTPPPLPNLPHQKILFGPPGTGKSHKIETEYAKGHYRARTTFHPDTDYASFVGAYKPVMNANNEIEYQFRPQVFAETYWAAWQQPERAHFLVIEEINRGNCAQIFGDLFQLLDRDAAGYSSYAGRADADLAQWLSAQLANADAAGPDTRARYVTALHQRNATIAAADAGQWLLLPPNLYLYATMNTSDQSLFPMDSAFKRRWEWEYVPIEYNKVEDVVLDLAPVAGRYKWEFFLRAVNERIHKFSESEDKQLGNYFVKPQKGAGERIINFDTFKSKVLFYLWSDVYKLAPESTDNIFQYIPTGKTDPESFSYAKLFEPSKAAEILPSFLARLELLPLADEASAPATDSPTDDTDEAEA